MKNLFQSFGVKQSESDFAPLEPVAKYFPPLDCLIYLTEDQPYRAVRLSPLITVLLHPSEDRAIGIKVKGTREVVERVRAILFGHDIKLSDTDVIEVLQLIEVAFTISMGDQLMLEADAARRERYEPEVKRLAKEAGAIRLSELQMEAA